MIMSLGVQFNFPLPICDGNNNFSFASLYAVNV